MTARDGQVWHGVQPPPADPPPPIGDRLFRRRWPDENNLIAAGAVWALFLDALGGHSVLEAVDIVTDAEGNATNQIEISLSFMNSPYRLTVERVDQAEAGA